MFRYLIIFSIILNTHSSIYAQKSHRAAKAMNELKFDKSIELFGDVLIKDSNDIISLIGYSTSYLYTNSIEKKLIPKNILLSCFRNLAKAKIKYKFINQNDGIFLQNELHVYNDMSIDSFMVTTSILLWYDYIKVNKSIAETEYYFSNYYIPNSRVLPNIIENAIDFLYYDSLSKKNNLDDYNLYINKFPKGAYYEIAQEKIIDLEYNKSMLSEGVEDLLNFNFKYTSNKYKKTVNKEIQIREYKLAFNNFGVQKLEEFIKKYPNSELIDNAKSEIEERDYKLTKNSNELSFYDSFLIKHPNSLLHKNEIEDSISNKLFYKIITDENREKLKVALEKITNFHESERNKIYIDSINIKIYRIDYKEALITNNLEILKTFSNNYKKLSYPNISIIRKRLFSIWEQSLLNNNNHFDENEFINFIKDYELESDIVFNNVLEKTKIYLSNYIDSLKPYIISDILMKNNFYSKLDEKLFNISKILSNKIYFKNQITNNEIIKKIKDLNFNFFDRVDLLNIFFTNISFSNAYIESIFENYNTILSVKNQTKTAGFNSKIYIWDATTLSYIENADLNTNNNICKAIMERYGVSSFTIPYFTGALNTSNNFEVRFYGFRSSDAICCPSYVIDMIYQLQDNHLTPITASGVYSTNGNAEITPKNFNYINIGMSLNLQSFISFIKN